MALLRHVATVSGWTAGSRVLGFVRDVLIAPVLGTGVVADAFFVAFRFPNMFRRIFAEGAFNAAFVPLFARRLEEEGEAAARRFAEEILAVFLFVLLALTAAAMAAMPWLMHVIAPGFLDDPDKFALTTQLSVIAFPYLLFMALMAFYGGVLNSLYRFKAAAAAPILLNVFFIAALLAIVPFTDRPGHVLAWTVAAAGVAQFLVVAIAARRAGMALRLPRPRVTPGVRRLVVLMVPGVLSAGVLQLNLIIGTIIASFRDGAVSYLYYADRIYQLPLGVIGIAFGIVLLPELSRKLRAGDHDQARTSLNRGIEFAMLLTLPATVAIAVIARPIIVVLFERGAFDRLASEATAPALVAFAVGLPAYVLVKVFQPAFFAREDTVTPLKFAAVSVLVNIGLSLALFPWLAHVGIALATAVAAWGNVALLALRLAGRGFWRADRRLGQRLLRVVIASAGMGVGLWLAAGWLEPWLDAGWMPRIAALLALVVGGLAAFAALALATRATGVAELKGLLRKPQAQPGEAAPLP